MAEWKQLLFDWEKTDRDRTALVTHLQLCGLPDADQKLILALKEHGEWTRDGQIARSILTATVRRLAELAGLSVGGLHKAKKRLILRRLLASHASVWVLSWARIWSMEYAPDARAIALFQGESVRACSRSPQYQEKRVLSLPEVQYQDQDQESGAQKEPSQFGENVGAQALRFRTAQVEAVLRTILRTIRSLERRHGTPPDKILQEPDAERIAWGILGDPDGVKGSQFEGVLRSMHRKDRFTESPAAYLTRCAQRRRWITADCSLPTGD